MCKTLVDKPFGMVVFHSNKNEIYLKNTVELQGQLDTKYGTHQFQPWYTGSGGLQISLVIWNEFKRTNYGLLPLKKIISGNEKVH